MKKTLLAIVMAALVIAAVCTVIFYPSHSETKKDIAASQTTTSTEITQTKIATDNAQVKDSDAISAIEELSNEQLGLTAEDRKKCSFMVSGSGEEIDGEYYVKIIAAIKNEEKDEKTGETSFMFDTKGEYYISYDGKKMLSKDLSTNKYSEIKQ